MAKTYSISVNSLFKGKNNIPYTFVIPSYQRGYRWEPVHIKHLLDDLYAFYFEALQNSLKKYCLQPIIVKPIDEKNNRWELVDGQQRLTSLWLMRQLCFAFRGEDEDDEENQLFYNLDFEGKKEFSDLIKKVHDKASDGMNGYIKKLRKDKDEDDTFLYDKFKITKDVNIDIDCVIECIKTILLEKDATTKLKKIFSEDINTIHDKTSDSVLMIWYQLESDDNPVTVFSNINANKIKLTESELIKAQILSSLSGDDREQDETSIATRWEAIEQALCQDDLWYFLNAGSGKETGTRIDFLFDIWKGMTSEETEERELWCANCDGLNNINSDYPLSDLVENTLKSANEKHSECAKAIWSKISELFDSLLDWKNDYYFYHIIGLLIAINEIKRKRESKPAAEALIEKYICTYKNKKAIASKDEFKDFLKTELRNVMYQMIGTGPEEQNYYNFVSVVKSLSYDNPTDHNNIRIILLMYNIASLINAQNEHERFPFDLFFADKYDIEHVNPQTPDEDRLDLEEIQKWYKALDIELDYCKIRDTHTDKSKSQQAEELLKYARNYSSEKGINSIGNLVLLDSNTNRGYQNKNFAEKRKDIVDILRTGQRVGNSDNGQEKYIPIGTKWVFLKAFSEMNDDTLSVKNIWNGYEDYENDIILQLWFLQSGLREEGNTHVYSVYSKDPVDIGLVRAMDGGWYYFEGDKLVVDRNIEVPFDKTNGLCDEGTYYFDGKGEMRKVISSNNSKDGATE